jgi:hypothetical protein
MPELCTVSCLHQSTSPRAHRWTRIHSTVDGVLKELKSASRELQKIFASFRLELELLDRLFYKNKNQHRGALFWRKVTEMRRFGHKLDHQNPMGWWKMPAAGSGDLLISRSERGLQKSPGDHLSVVWTSPKMLKGSWTHCPDDKSLANVIKRLQLSRALCDEVNALPPFPSSISSSMKTTSPDFETPDESIRVGENIPSWSYKNYLTQFQALPPLFAICRVRTVAAYILCYFCEIQLTVQGIADLTLVCSRALRGSCKSPQ